MVVIEDVFTFILNVETLFSLRRYFPYNFYRISCSSAYFSKCANAHDQRKLFSTVDSRYFRTLAFGTDGECFL